MTSPKEMADFGTVRSALHVSLDPFTHGKGLDSLGLLPSGLAGFWLQNHAERSHFGPLRRYTIDGSQEFCHLSCNINAQSAVLGTVRLGSIT